MIKYLALVLIMISCGKVETPEEFFDITGDKGKDGVSIVGDPGKDGVDGTNGVDGKDGVDGEDADVTLVEICPDIPGSHIETLVKSGNDYLAFLASRNYKKERLVLLEEDVIYTTTDTRRINFSIVNGEVICE